MSAKDPSGFRVPMGESGVTKIHPILRLSVFYNLCSFVLAPWTFKYPLVMVRLVRLDER